MAAEEKSEMGLAGRRRSRRVHLDGRGQGLVEYALILVLVAIIVVVVLATMGQEVRQVFSDVVNSLSGSSS
jgi:pilus assembly protein Flp/PilA